MYEIKASYFHESCFQVEVLDQTVVHVLDYQSSSQDVPEIMFRFIDVEYV